MDPAAAFLVDALVNGQVQALDQGQQSTIAGTCAHCDVGGLAALVLARGSAAHNLVQLGAAVTAIHMDGSTPGIAQRVQHMVDQGVQRGDCACRGRVVDAQPLCSRRAGEFLEGEVSHRLSMRIWALG